MPGRKLQPPPKLADTNKRMLDSLDANRLANADTTRKRKMTKSSLDAKLEHAAEDSVVIDNVNKITYLYGKARVIYQDFELDADYIRFDSKNNLIFARGVKNKNGKYVGRPIFKMQGQGSSVADSLAYNTKSGKGDVYGVYTAQEGGFFSGGKTRKQPDNEVHVSGTTFSTCNLPEPHFGIHITKGIATENQIITGPVYMEFERVPLPLALPFAFFPKPNKKSSGILLPTPGEDATRGFFLQGGGYYLALNDYWDAKLTGDLYTNGSYNVNLLTNYTKRYKYNGNFNLAYASTRNGLEGTPEYTPQKSFRIMWSHTQNANLHPGTTFSASVNAGTSSHYRINPGNSRYDFNQIADNQLNSSITYGKVFGPNNMFNFAASLNHSQRTTDRSVNLTLPQITLNMTSLNPFDRKDRVGEQKWYQKINVGYSMQAQNTVNSTEDQLFKQGGLNRFRNGMSHSIPINLSLNVLKYLNFTSGGDYTERWHLQTINKRQISRSIGDSVAIDTVNGFKRAGNYSLRVGFTTKVYGKKLFSKKGWLHGIQHVITPSINFSYSPDFSSDRFSYYKDLQYFTDDIRPGRSIPTGEFVRDQQGRVQRYSIFENSVYGGPGMGKQAAIGFNFDNTVEIKVRNRKDTTGTGDKKIAILQGLTFSSSYNFVQEQKKLAPVSFNGRSQFTEKLGISFYGSLSPYLVENVARTSGTGINQTTSYALEEVDKYVWNHGKLPRLTSLNFSFGYSLNPEALKRRNENLNQANQQANQMVRTPAQNEALAAVSRDPNAFVDFNIPWNFTFAYSFDYRNPTGFRGNKSITNTLTFNGDFNLTPKWKIQFNSGIDFSNKGLAPTSFAIYRDLHCWDFSANWVPFGPYRSYSIDIRVKASILQDLKLSKRQGYQTRY